MTFDLLPSLTPYAVAFVVLAALASLAALAVLVTEVGSHRRTRVARHESVRRYYGRLVLSH